MAEKILYSTKSFRIRLVNREYLLDTLERMPPSPVEEAIKSIPQIVNPISANVVNACTVGPKTGIKIADQLPDIEIKFSAGELEAYLIINCSEEELAQNKTSVLQQIRAEIQNKEIVFGILPDALQSLSGNGKILLARGTEPIQGEDSILNVPDVLTVKYTTVDDVVDYYNLNLIHTFKRGEVIGDRLDPTPGIPGKSVTGKDIPPRPGQIFPLHYDRNTIEECIEENKTVLRALTSGALHLYDDGKTLTIFECLEIPNVDYSTGNIDTECFLIIQNTIEDGFSVRSSRGIEIQGRIGVGKVLIECGGDILLRGGISGKGEGRIHSQGSVYTKFVNHATIVSENIVDVGGDCIDAVINAAKVVVGSVSKGSVIGGSIEALYSIQCKSAGNEYDKETLLTVSGFDRENVEAEERSGQDQLVELKKELSRMKLVLKSETYTTQTTRNPAHISEIKQGIRELQNCIRDTEGVIRFFKDVLKTKGEGEIIISKLAYPNTNLKIRHETVKITERRFGCRYCFSQNAMREML